MRQSDLKDILVTIQIYIYILRGRGPSQTPPVFGTQVACVPSLCTLNITLIIFMACKFTAPSRERLTRH